jgi:choline dehydrogenase
MSDQYDVVVVGAGSAGGTVAGRLSEDPDCRVLLMEAGPDYPNEEKAPPPWFVLGAFSGGSGPPERSLDWGYLAEPVRPGGAPIPAVRGKLVGGSSMINGCVLVRGRPEDFERWVDAGATGWDWETVRPFYEAAEEELTVMTYPEELWLPIQRLFVDGNRELGFRYIEDMNAPDAWDGIVGKWPRNRKNEIRQGSLVTYIRKARARPNFQVRDHAHADRVLIEGTQAQGVSFIDANGQRDEVRADRVILSGGAYGSAPILLRSGIGPAQELQELAIETIVDLPVGRPLLDHAGVHFLIKVDKAFARVGWPFIAVASRAKTYYGVPISVNEDSGLATMSNFLASTDKPHGSIRLRSADPLAPPIIDQAFGTLIDTGAFDEVWEDFNALLETAPYREAGASDLQAGTPLKDRLEVGIGSAAHPASGCGIGAVVDPDLNVYGVEGLSVCDASVFPCHVTNNPNLTCHLVGEVLAAKLSGRLPAAATAEHSTV